MLVSCVLILRKILRSVFEIYRIFRDFWAPAWRSRAYSSRERRDVRQTRKILSLGGGWPPCRVDTEGGHPNFQPTSAAGRPVLHPL